MTLKRGTSIRREVDFGAVNIEGESNEADVIGNDVLDVPAVEVGAPNHRPRLYPVHLANGQVEGDANHIIGGDDELLDVPALAGRLSETEPSEATR